jgi:integrase/recombinase XerC
VIIDDFILWLEAERRYSPLTVRNYRHDIADFLSFHSIEPEKFNPKAIKRKHIEEWIINLSGKRKLKNSSVNRYVATLRTLWRWMLSHGYIEKNIMHRVFRQKESRILPVHIPESRIDDIVERLSEDIASDDFLRLRDALIILLFYTAGLRLSELVDADISDVSQECDAIRVMGKGGKERIQPITAVVGAVLKKYFNQIISQNICIGQKKALILSQKGERISRRTVQRIVNRVLKECGMQGRTSPHVLRHTFATHLLNCGTDLREIQELMGHSSLRATQVYTHLDIAKLKEVYATAHPRARE